jgi:hypothetical protein
LIYYVDTEFTKFNGELISIALVPEKPVEKGNLYLEFETSDDIDPWVRINVIPKLNGFRRDRITNSRIVQSYLSDDDDVTVVADWPEDLTHFLSLLITGPGTMLSMDNIKTHLKRTRKWNTADASAIPHHALYDAIALRNYWESKK